MDLTNDSAIVTGGASDFGSATSRRLAQMGAKVVIADVADERGEALARRGSRRLPLRALPGRAPLRLEIVPFPLRYARRLLLQFGATGLASRYITRTFLLKFIRKYRKLL
jgi:NAD(P)-dependent dehydrogenase (short-subunit alcohol dehydrogenase family)